MFVTFMLTLFEENNKIISLSYLSDFFFDAETNTIVAGNKDSEEVEWEDRNDKFYAEHFDIACSFDHNEPNNQKLMQFDLKKTDQS